MSESTDEHATMVSDCITRESRLSDRDRSFIDSIGKYLADGRTLTPRQTDTLSKIWEAATRPADL